MKMGTIVTTQEPRSGPEGRAVLTAKRSNVQGSRSLVAGAADSLLLLAALVWAFASGVSAAEKPRIRFVAAYSPPLVFADANGKIAGVNVDLFNTAAQRAGYSVEWVVTQGNPVDVLLRGEADLFHALPLEPAPPASLYVTKPWIRAEYVALLLQGKDPMAPDLRTVMIDHPIDRVVQNRLFPHSIVSFVGTRDAGLQAICDGRADALITSPRISQSLARGLPPGCADKPMDWIERPNMSIPVAVGARREFAREAERIRSEIASIVTRGEGEGFYARYGLTVNRSFSSMVTLAEFETQRDRIWTMLMATLVLASLLLVALGVAITKNREARRARLAAESATRAKSDFLAVMSHEIRTPLHGCLGLTELLLQTPLSPEQRDLAELSARSASNLNSLLGDILDLNRIESAKLVLEPAPFDPAALVEQAAQMTRALLSAPQVEVLSDLSPSLPPYLTGDESRIRQVLLNLAMNATKFTTEGSITIRAAYEHGQLQTSVQDTGPGIAAGLRARIFEPFEQGDASSTRKHGGSGLGLAIAKQLIDLMQGEIGVNSEVGQGSTFWFNLPLPVGLAPAAEESPAERPAMQGTILLVEDNPVNRKVAARLLENLGLQVEVATDGEAALRMMESVAPGLILMDCQMPGMDGLEATRRIRSSEQRREVRTPIIALTADVSIENRERCRTAGMDDFLGKPLSVEALAGMLRRWLQLRTGDPERV